MAQARITVTYTRSVVIDVDDDFDPNADFEIIPIWTALSKAGFTPVPDGMEATDIKAEWEHTY